MDSLKKLISVIQEDIIGTDNKFIAGVWLACISTLIGAGIYLSSESMSFLGVADSRELQVNFEYPVEIKRLHVIPGQIVRKGDLLVELDQSELNSRIRLLRQTIAKLEAEMQVRQHLNTIVSNSGDLRGADPLRVDIEDLTAELRDLEEKKRNLYLFADVDGIVGGVSFKQGEMVPAFTSLLTLSPEHPSYVQGFVHESLRTRLEIGRTVKVIPMSSGSPAVEGRIVSVGSRIILMPPRLLSSPLAQVYGREVVVQIPAENRLLLGEKVQIKPKWSLISFSSANASLAGLEKSPEMAEKKSPALMRLPPAIARRFSFEPSGALYLSDLKKFLVVSDDTDDNDSPALFLVDRDGHVEDQTLLIPNVKKITDLESVSQDGDTLYLMTSQSLTKKGKTKAHRNLFVRARRDGLRLWGTESLEFRPLLETALKNSSDPLIQTTFKNKWSELEIESHLVESQTLYVGFKAPLTPQGQPLILVIRNMDEVFSKKRIDPKDLSVLDVLPFEGAKGGAHRLSELIRIKGRFYAATVCEDETCGAVWTLQTEGIKLRPLLVEFYEGLKPEGLAFDPNDLSLFVVFDEKEKPAKFAKLPLTPATASKAPPKNEK